MGRLYKVLTHCGSCAKSDRTAYYDRGVVNFWGTDLTGMVDGLGGANQFAVLLVFFYSVAVEELVTGNRCPGIHDLLAWDSRAVT